LPLYIQFDYHIKKHGEAESPHRDRCDFVMICLEKNNSVSGNTTEYSLSHRIPLTADVKVLPVKDIHIPIVNNLTELFSPSSSSSLSKPVFHKFKINQNLNTTIFFSDEIGTHKAPLSELPRQAFRFKINSLNGTASESFFGKDKNVYVIYPRIHIICDDIFELVKVISIDPHNQIKNGELVEGSLLKYNNELLDEQCVKFSSEIISAHGGKNKPKFKTKKSKKSKKPKFKTKKDKKIKKSKRSKI